MKNNIFLFSILLFCCIYNFRSFAETRTFDVGGEVIKVETFGNAQFYDGKVEEGVSTRSVEKFSFNINDYVQTGYIQNTHSKWRVQTRAYLRHYHSLKKNASGDTNYIVAIRDSSGKKLFSYTGKTDNVYGGVTFSKVPKKKLCISVSKVKKGAWFLYGEGDTQFLD